MELQQWIDIVNYKQARKIQDIYGIKHLDKLCPILYAKDRKTLLADGAKALDDMCTYGCKDAMDTMKIVLDIASHCEFKSNVLQYKGMVSCKDLRCGSLNVRKNGTRILSGIKYQNFWCTQHNGHAGRALIKSDGTYGKML